MIVAFIELSDTKAKFIDTDEAKEYVNGLTAAAKDHLLGTIPAYMIPNACLILKDIPQTTSGKIDRGMIRKIAMTLPSLIFYIRIKDIDVLRKRTTK
jgi:acyl-coenzyme A synthetase/AMP-(fatty) acid ligase